MPADLDQLFAALGSHADGVPLREPDQARRRGERRRRNRLTAAMVAVAVLTATALGGAVWLRGRAHEPAMPQPTVTFVPLRPVGDGLPIRFGDSDNGAYALTAVVDGRGFAGVRTATGDLSVGAVELATGQAAWPIRDLGNWGDWNGMIATPQGIIVIGEHDTGESPDHVAMVLDPATGALRWQTGVDDLDLTLFASVLVVTDSRQHAIRGLDWVTGAERWRATLTAGAQLESFAPAQPRPGLRPLGPTADDNRLIEVSKTSIRILDARTGRVLDTRAATLPSAKMRESSPSFATAGNLIYAVGNYRGTEIAVYDLAAGGDWRVAYTPPADQWIMGSGGCGPGRICVFTTTLTDNERPVVQVIEVATGRVVARLAGGRSASAWGDRLLTDGGTLTDLAGTVVSSEASGMAGWVTGGSILMIRPTALTEGSPATTAQVLGVSASDGHTMSLGPIPTPLGYCDWDTRYLICPTADGLRVWRFAAD